MADQDLATLAEKLSGDVEQLAAILEFVPVGVLIARSSDGRIVFCNHAAKELDAERLGEASRPALTRSFEAGEVVVRASSEHDGRHLEITSAPIRGSANEIEAAIAFVSDVTAEHERTRAERDFVTNAAHELQTPIAAIVSAIDVLESGAKDDPEHRDLFLTHIGAAAKRLGALIHALLTLARAESQQEAPRQEVISLRALLVDVAEGFADSRVRIECPADLAVVSNPVLIEQALINLCDNAIKHGGGALLTGRRDGTRVVIGVRDAGSGIAAAERERVFERFYRSEDAATDGFGLGLAIAREAVEAADGSLRIDSGPGGTTVSVELRGASIR